MKNIITLLSGLLKFGWLYGVILSIALFSCEKEDSFLDKKPIQSLTVPTTLQDFQEILNNESVFNSYSPSLGVMSGEDYYVTTSIWTNSTGTATERNAYLWAKEIYNGEQGYSWDALYKAVYYANVVLDGLSGFPVSTSNQSQFNQIKGSALFYRSIAYFDLLQLFSAPYSITSTGNELGIPLRLNSDLNIKSTRALQNTCYEQVLNDLQLSLQFLPTTSTYKTQPSKIAVWALLARVYLIIGDYEKSHAAANSCLSAYSNLLDFNDITPTTFSISTEFVSEDIFHTGIAGSLIFGRTRAIIDSTLYRSYEDNDLRKSVYFYTSADGQIRFRGTYDFTGQKFSGLATDEIYLTRAECNARLGRTDQAMTDLNILLRNRWKKDSNGNTTYLNKSASTTEEALAIILKERRKELLFRGLRWYDLRRLNKEPRFATTLTRVINGVTYTLPPNDKKYVFPIPDNEIKLSGIEQNER